MFPVVAAAAGFFVAELLRAEKPKQVLNQSLNPIPEPKPEAQSEAQPESQPELREGAVRKADPKEQLYRMIF